VIALLPALLLAFSPLEAEEPEVREGNEKLVAGDAQGALRHYEAAERAAGPRAEIDYDRGEALYRQGKPAEARDAWRRALERGPGALSSRALQNLGNALDATGDRDGAIEAFTEALRKDPGNEDARLDLEVLLRRRSAGKGAPKDPGPEGAGKKDAGDPKAGAGARPAPPSPERRGQRNEPETTPERKEQAERRPAGGPPTAGTGEAEGPRAAPLSRQDAERLLDALRSRERNMPLAGRDRGQGRRTDAARDW
jgi:tetratricopeptide (TPR) repeat protein